MRQWGEDRLGGLGGGWEDRERKVRKGRKSFAYLRFENSWEIRLVTSDDSKGNNLPELKSCHSRKVPPFWVVCEV